MLSRHSLAYSLFTHIIILICCVCQLNFSKSFQKGNITSATRASCKPTGAPTLTFSCSDRYIKSKEEREFVSVYTDEGISATNTKKHEGFNTMIADALAGKIDMIITKSVSRFARNTVDTLTTVRELKSKCISADGLAMQPQIQGRKGL